MKAPNRRHKLAMIGPAEITRYVAKRQSESTQMIAARHLSTDLQAACAIAYTFGWRMRSEVLALDRRHVHLGAGTLSLDAGMTKNGEGRVVYLTPDLKAALAAKLACVDARQKKRGRVIPALFPHAEGHHKAWASACAAAGVPGMLKHDFRRTAVRNMERSGVPRSVATELTGHKTEAVYRRDAIVNDADLRDASLRPAGTFPGTPGRARVDVLPLAV